MTAVRGNNDREAWADALPEIARLECDGMRLLVVHDLKHLRDASDAHLVVSGHSHRPDVARRGGALYVNPGSTGPRRFSLPVTLAHLDIATSGCDARVVLL